MTVYATHDNEQTHITENADIFPFDTEAEARDWLLDHWADFVRDAEADGEPVTITTEWGDFGDCWVKSHLKPSADDIGIWCAPFPPDEMHIRAPGTHPGGKQWWISPGGNEVMVATVAQA
jgi:hypothetical protein